MRKTKQQAQKPPSGETRVGLIQQLHSLFEKAVADGDLVSAARLADTLLRARSITEPDTEVSVELLRDKDGARCPTCLQKISEEPLKVRVIYDDEPVSAERS